MALNEIGKQIRSLNARIGQLEKAAADPLPSVVAARYKRSEAITKGDVYVIVDTAEEFEEPEEPGEPERIEETAIPNDTRPVRVALESSSDSIGTGYSWALCALSGHVWVNYKFDLLEEEEPLLNDFVHTSSEAGKASFSSGAAAGAFGRVVRIRSDTKQVLVNVGGGSGGGTIAIQEGDTPPNEDEDSRIESVSLIQLSYESLTEVMPSVAAIELGPKTYVQGSQPVGGIGSRIELWEQSATGHLWHLAGPFSWVDLSGWA